MTQVQIAKQNENGVSVEKVELEQALKIILCADENSVIEVTIKDNSNELPDKQALYKVNAKVKTSGFDELKSLSKKLNKQLGQVEKTVTKISDTKLETWLEV